MNSSGPQDRAVADLFVYPDEAYDNGRKHLPENFFSFGLEQDPETKVIEIYHETFYNTRNGKQAARSPGIDLDKTYYAKDLAAAMEICANLTYHEIDFLAKTAALETQLKALRKKSLALHRDSSKQLRDRVFADLGLTDGSTGNPGR